MISRRRLLKKLKRQLRWPRIFPFLTLWVAIRWSKKAYGWTFRLWYRLYCQSWYQSLFLQQNLHLMRELYKDILPPLPLNETVALHGLSEQLWLGFKMTNAKRDFSENLHCHGLEHLENIRDKGVILASAHLFLSHFVIGECRSHLQQMEYFAIGKASERQVFEKHGVQSYEIHEQHMRLQRIQELHRARKVLKRDGLVAIFADGKRGLPDESTRFLKRERPFASGMGQLAALTGKSVLLIDCHLRRDGSFQGNIQLLPNISKTKSDAQEISQDYTTEYIHWVEGVWHHHPESIYIAHLKTYLASLIHN